MKSKSYLLLEDGTQFEGTLFGADVPTSGEVVFSTGMTGYPEALTDPSFFGQILVLTFPLVGNYGVAASSQTKHNPFESTKIQAKALIISEYSNHYDHHQANKSLSNWLKKEGITGLSGIDTRALTKHLRENGSMLGKIVVNKHEPAFFNPNTTTLLNEVSIHKPEYIGEGDKTVALLDCGCKRSILNHLTATGVRVLRLPWNWDISGEKIDGLLISSGPGDPAQCLPVIKQAAAALESGLPTFGICLGHQIMALAGGAETYKLKFGHRSQNQPVMDEVTKQCYITSQNHGYAVKTSTLPANWQPWFTNLNDGTNEGLIDKSGRFFSVQFHPEAAPGPYDTTFLFHKFTGIL